MALLFPMYVLPAQAGMIPSTEQPNRSTVCAPRASGDDPIEVAKEVGVNACSPRKRG